MGRRVLITGGAGFIGSTAADQFLAAGWDVAILDDLSSGKRTNVPAAARFYPVDIRSDAALEAIKKERPQVICHQAAQIDVRRSMADPRFDADVNVGGLLNLMQAAMAVGSVEHVVFASSGGATYGDTDVVPTPESHPQRPISCYGAAKAASEIYLGVYRANHGIQVTALRYANVYGPRQDPHGEAGVVAIFCGRLLEGKPCTIFGDGGQTRDYVFVGDVARANVLAAEKRLRRAAQRRHRRRDRRERRLHATWPAPPGSTGRPSTHPRGWASSAAPASTRGRPVQAIGWRPEVPMADGLARTMEFFRKRGAEGPRGRRIAAARPAPRLAAVDGLGAGGVGRVVSAGSSSSSSAGRGPARIRSSSALARACSSAESRPACAIRSSRRRERRWIQVEGWSRFTLTGGGEQRGHHHALRDREVARPRRRTRARAPASMPKTPFPTRPR